MTSPERLLCVPISVRTPGALSPYALATVLNELSGTNLLGALFQEPITFREDAVPWSHERLVRVFGRLLGSGPDIHQVYAEHSRGFTYQIGDITVELLWLRLSKNRTPVIIYNLRYGNISLRTISNHNEHNLAMAESGWRSCPANLS